MLFQSDSENGGENGSWDDEICWGDMGVANFLSLPKLWQSAISQMFSTPGIVVEKTLDKFKNICYNLNNI